MGCAEELGDSAPDESNKRKGPWSPEAHQAPPKQRCSSDRPPLFQESLAFMMILKNKLDDNAYREFIRIMDNFSKQRYRLVECVDKVHELFELHSDLALRFDNFLPEGFQPTQDLSKCPRPTPSYCFLPGSNLLKTAHEARELEKAVLNNCLLSKAINDTNFTNRLMNKHEEFLFKCEDDRFELDVFINRLTSTFEKVEKWVQAGKFEPELTVPIPCEDLGLENAAEHFISHDVRCIESLYEEHGLDFIDDLRENMSVGLPILLTHLKKKLAEASTMRANVQKVWNEVYKKNLPRALDCKASYLKGKENEEVEFSVRGKFIFDGHNKLA